jgi:hypothetical protein
MLKAIGEGDTVIVTRLDRLARSTRDLLNVLSDVWADTTSAQGKLLRNIRPRSPNSSAT